jgi:hypothetical protein
MSWETPSDKERFFEELARAFHTPATQTLVVPQIESNVTSTGPILDIRTTSKRPPSRDEPRDVKRQKSSTTGVGVRRVSSSETPKSVQRPSVVKRKSSEAFQKPSKDSDDKSVQPGILSGMILFFIPNSKKNGLRRYRMMLFAQNGANVRDTWSEDVTHIICDKSVTGERILRDLCLEQFPVTYFFER